MMAQHRMLEWRLSDFKGIRTSIAKEPYIFVIFQGGGRGPDPPVPPPSGSAHEHKVDFVMSDLPVNVTTDNI